MELIQGSLFGRMSLERSLVTGVRTSVPSSKKSVGSRTPKFHFLDLRSGNGGVHHG